MEYFFLYLDGLLMYPKNIYMQPVKMWNLIKLLETNKKHASKGIHSFLEMENYIP